MICRLLAIAFLVASTASAQPLVFGAAQRIPAPYGPVPNDRILLATNGDGFLLLSGKTLVKLDDAGRTLRRAPLPPQSIFAPESLWPLGKDYLLGTVYAPWWRIDGDTLSVRPVEPLFAPDAVVASNGSTTLALEAYARATLLDGEGAVLARPNLLVPAPPAGAGAIASDGAAYLAVWNDGSTLKAIALDGIGSVRGITDLWWADAPTNAPGRPLMAFGSGNYLVVWRDGVNVLARLVKPNAAAAADAITLATTGPSPFSVIWDGHEFLVAIGAQLAHIDAGGKLAAWQPLAASMLMASAHAVLALRWNVCHCYVCSELRAGPLGTAGEPVAGEEAYASTEWGVVAATERTAIVAYEEKSDRTRVRIDFVPSRGAPIALPSARETQSKPALATDGTSFLVAWIEPDDDCRGHLVAAIMDADGRFGPMAALSDSDIDPSLPPVVTWSGREYAVVWRRAARPQLAGVRVASFGLPLDAVPVTPVESGSQPSIAWSGDGYLLGWRNGSDYHVRRLGTDLRPVSDDVDLGQAFYGNVAWNGFEAVAFYRSVSELDMVRIDAAGKPGKPQTVPLEHSYGSPSVAWRNGEWLVTSVIAGGRVARVTRDGRVIEDVDLFQASVALASVSVAATPSRVVAIVETSNPPRTIRVRTTDPRPPRRRAAR